MALSASRLADDLADAGIELDSHQAEQLLRFYELVEERNPDLNMTRIRGYEATVRKHYVDSLIILRYLKRIFPPLGLPASILDFGTGAGFPGVPLAIACPETRVILNESRANRAEFLEDVVEECGLKNATVLGKRLAMEDDIHVDAVIARAVSTMADLLTRTIFSIKKGGSIIYMKGPNCDAEIAEMGAGVSLLLDQSYTLPASEDHRRLVCFRVDDPGEWKAPGSNAISSRENEKFKMLISLQSSRGIRKNGLCLIGGKKIVSEVVSNARVRVQAAVVPQSFSGSMPPDVRQFEFKNDLFAQIDELGTGAPLLLAEIPEMSEWDGRVKGLCVVIPFQDPENVGAAIRSAVAFGAGRIILTKECANPFLARAIRSSAGAVFVAPLVKGPSLVELLENYPEIYQLSSDGIALEDVNFSKDILITAGLEGPGLPGAGGNRLRIIMRSDVESLNAATALAIALYEFDRSQRRKT